MVICVLSLELDQLIFKNGLLFVEVLEIRLIFLLEFFKIFFKNPFVVNENLISI